MGMTINTNISSLNTYRNLNSTQNELSKSLEKLSSGLRINHASDDAAGLTIATGLDTQVRGLTVAGRNAQDGISVLQTAEGALGEATNILQRLRELAVQAANDSNSVAARTAIGNEATALQSELTRIKDSTNFNGIFLLNGSKTSLDFQVGAKGDAASKVTASLTDANLTTVASALASTSSAAYTMTANTTNTAYTFTTGATSVVKTVAAGLDGIGLANALNADTDFAAAFVAVGVDGTHFTVTSRLGSAMSSTQAAGAGIAAGSVTAAAIQFDTAAHAQSAIGVLDTQISTIAGAVSSLGVQQNRFHSAVNSVNVAIENLTASKSRITDVDMAQEMVKYTRAQILSQSGTAMLAQANSLPQLALKLLQG